MIMSRHKEKAAHHIKNNLKIILPKLVLNNVFIRVDFPIPVSPMQRTLKQNPW